MITRRRNSDQACRLRYDWGDHRTVGARSRPVADRGHVRRLSALRNALVVALVSGACDSAPPVEPAVRPPARTEQLWTSHGATLVGPPDEPTLAGVHGVSFRISVPNAEELTTQLRDYVERGAFVNEIWPPWLMPKSGPPWLTDVLGFLRSRRFQ
jgi:hypothetical protein